MDEKIIIGNAAKLVGLSRVDFLLSLHKFNVPMIGLEEDEILLDIENA